MDRVPSLLAAAPLLLSLASAASAQLDDRCAPPGMRPPLLSRLVVPDGPDLLYLQGDPALEGGVAALLVELRQGPILPPGPCTLGLQGRLVGLRPVRSMGRVAWNLPLEATGALSSVRVLAWPAAGAWGQTHRSNRVVLPPQGGVVPGQPAPPLVITEVQKDPTTVPDGLGEWLEVTNPGTTAVDIEGWILADHGSDQAVLDNGGLGIVVPPGGALVLGRESDPGLNGGVPVDAVYAGFTLSNGEDEVVLVRPDGTVEDQVVYDDGLLWPDEPGRALALDPTRTDVGANDDPAAWCSSTTVLGAGPDTGTPGATNGRCSG